MRKMSRTQVRTFERFLIAYIAIQGMLLITACIQQVWIRYLPFAGAQLTLGVIGTFAVLRWIGADSAARLVLWSISLLSIGQLIQVILQQGEAYDSYVKNFWLFLFVALILSAMVGVFYKYLYLLMGDLRGTWLLIGLSAACIGILALFGSEENGAKLWIRVGGISIQLTEILKLLFIFAACSIICIRGKLSLIRQIGLIVFIGVTAAGVAVGLNEFGTGLVLGLTGLFLLYLFSRKSAGKWIVFVVMGFLLLAGLCVMGGFQIYRQLPMEVSNEVFGKQFSATANREVLIQVLRENGDHIKEDARGDEDGKNAAPSVVQMDMDNFLQFLEEELTDQDVDMSYPDGLYSGAEFPEEAQRQQRYIVAITTLAGSDLFRELFNNYFISSDIYANRMLAAFRENYQDVSGPETVLRKCQEGILILYVKGMDKVKDKFTGFLRPEEEALGSAYQINNGIESMATGGLLGNGPEVVMNRDVFASNSDMVFAMIVSELGGIFGIAVIVLNMLILKEALEISMLTSSWYQKGICIAVGSSWFLQAVIIIAGNCRWIPLTGITLPLVSDGGSSLVVSIVSIVLLIAIAARPVPEYWYGRSGISRGSGRKKSKRFSGFVKAAVRSLHGKQRNDEKEPEDLTYESYGFTEKQPEDSECSPEEGNNSDSVPDDDGTKEQKTEEKADNSQAAEEWEGFSEED